MTSAERRSIAATNTSDGHGNDTGEHQLRQVPGEVGLEAVDPLHRGRDDLPFLGAVRRPRLAAEASLDEVDPKLGEHRRGPRGGR